MAKNCGKIYVIDGLDGSGKSTQAELILQELKKITKKVILISYPNYANASSALVKMYLDGEFSDDLADVNAYAASSFYAVDRYASYKKDWQKLYEEGYIIIASRYQTSNQIHQTVKLLKEQWDSFLEWSQDYEYNKLQLPIPDKVIFLDLPRKIADRLITKRYAGDNTKKDIHESNLNYLEQCQETAHYCAKKFNWQVINCACNDDILPIDTIKDEILSVIKSDLGL